MKIAIVTNTLAGSGKAIKLSSKIRAILETKHIDSKIFKETEWDAQIYQYDQAWVVGGDGTINYFVNQFNDIKIPLCLFNGGTGNDFYSILYGKTTLEKQIAHCLESPSRPVDAGKCNDRYFLNGVGIGFEGAVAKSLMGVNKLRGKASFMLSILKHIFWYKEQRYAINSVENKMENSFLMISIANGKRYAGGFYVAPLAEPDDGLLDANFVSKLSPFKRLQFLPVIEKGKHLSSPIIQYYRTKAITISSDKIIQAHLDGEYIESEKLHIEILPSHFNIIY